MLKFQQQESPLIDDDKRAELMNEAKEHAVGQTGGEEEFLTVSSRDKAVKKGTIILTILFVVGIAALVLMIKKVSPGTASATESSQDTVLKAAVAQITGIKKELAGDIQSSKIYEMFDVDKKQIKVGDLKKNPFMLDKAVAETPANPAIDSATEAAAKEQRRLEAQAGNMRLLAIMVSPNGNSCMINDKIVYKGDKVNGFDVLAIADDSVELISQGTKITLRIVAGK
jgi:preprotein translocase subunit SecG